MREHGAGSCSVSLALSKYHPCQVWKRSGAWFYRGLPKYILPLKTPGRADDAHFRPLPMEPTKQKPRSTETSRVYTWARGRGKSPSLPLPGEQLSSCHSPAVSQLPVPQAPGQRLPHPPRGSCWCSVPECLQLPRLHPRGHLSTVTACRGRVRQKLIPKQAPVWGWGCHKPSDLCGNVTAVGVFGKVLKCVFPKLACTLSSRTHLASREGRPGKGGLLMSLVLMSEMTLRPGHFGICGGHAAVTNIRSGARPHW